MVTQAAIGALLISVGLGLFALAYIMGREGQWRSNLYLILLTLSGAFYSFGYGMDLSGTALWGMSLSWIMGWTYFEYVGIAYLPTAVVYVAVYYTKGNSILNKVWFWLLFAFSTATLLIAWTNSWHGLLYQRVWVDARGTFPILGFEVGWWLKTYDIYSLITGLFAVGLFLRYWLFSMARDRHIFGVMFLGSIIPLLSHILLAGGLIPYEIDTTPLSIALTTMIFYWALFYKDFSRIMPVARDAVFEWIKDAVLVLDDRGNLVDYNHAAEKLFFREELPLKKARNDLVDKFSFVIDLLPIDQPYENLIKDLKIQERHYRASIINLDRSQKQTKGYVMAFHDITDDVKKTELLRSLAMSDELTGLFNRRYFLQTLRNELERAKRYQRMLSVAIMDLDHFKLLNDNHGHDAGDDVLRQVSHVCQEGLRATDTMARYGGEEFVFCLPETDAYGAKVTCERLRTSLSKIQISFYGAILTVSASFGVFTLTPGQQDCLEEALQQLISYADQALYQAKGNGRNQVVHYDDMSVLP